MKTIKITDDRLEMESIGKKIAQEKESIYTDKMKKSIFDTIKHYRPEISEQELIQEYYRSIYDYWAFGNNIDEEYFWHFDEKTAEEKMTYMTMRVRRVYLNRLNNPHKAYIFNDKYETYKLLGKYYYRDVVKLETENDFEIFEEFVSKHEEFIVKPLDMGLGIGVHKYTIDRKKTLLEQFRILMNEGVANNEAYSWSKTPAIILEEIIDQHEALSQFHPNSVNAVRLSTVRIGEKVIPYYPWIKVGNNGSDIATAAIGGMDAGIDSITGIINTSAIGEDGGGVDVHPVSGVRFIGYQIPQWDELIKLSTEIALSLPKDVNYIGWDFVLTKNNKWCIMEGNYSGEFMWQLIYNRGMRKEFEDLINWKMDKEFWWQ